MADEMNDVRRALIAATRKFRRSETAYKRDLEELRQAIMASVDDRQSISQIARDTGYSREYVSGLVRKLKDEAATKSPAE